MKCKIPEISWHNRDPVLSVDIQPNFLSNDSTSICRLASGGTDAHVLIWYINRAPHGDDIELEFAADLSRHQRAVNTVRWSPNADLLASGDDESVIFIWKQKGENEVNITDDTNEPDKEIWVALKVLRGHTEDIYDLSWSPNSQFLVTGSVDNTAMMWDVHKGKSMAILDDHKGYVQGVAWDPKNQYIATMSTDRHMRIFDIRTRKVLHRISKSLLPVPKNNEMHTKSIRLYHDGTLQTFFRRLCFTPDGKLLLTPAGVTDYDGVFKQLHTTYAFSRCDMRKPVFVLPCSDQYTIAVRCSPILYELRVYDVEKNPPIIDLPYRMIFAVATKSSVYFYDTQQKQPFAIISNIHYTRLTDLTWSSDGCIVIVSSTDGFCSLITFTASELGNIYSGSDAVLNTTMNTEKMFENGKKFKKPKHDHQHRTGLSEYGKTNRVSNSIEVQCKAAMSDATEHMPTTAFSFLNIKKDNQSNLKSIVVETTDFEKKKPKIQEDVKILCHNQNSISVNEEERGLTNMSITEQPQQMTVADKAHKQSLEKVILNRLLEPTYEKISQKALPNKEVTMPIAMIRNINDGINKVSNILKEKEKKLPIVFDLEILNSVERFESPEKKSHPPTPIKVRRNPRTPHSTTSISTSPSTKRATPIAVRRTPRSTIVIKDSNEEAMDAWPSMIQDKHMRRKQSGFEEVPLERPISIDPTFDSPEDIRLIYEDTIEEVLTTKVSKALTLPCQIPETPRRIALKTISTPKTEKKLL